MSRSLRWYINRLRSMGPAEVVHRIGESSRKSFVRRNLDTWTYADDGGAVPSLPGIAIDPHSASPKLAAAIRAESEQILDGHFSALGRIWPKRPPANLFPADVWSLDPVTGGHWQAADAFCFDIRYRRERTLGDVKYVWEFNKLQFLQPLAADFALSGNRRALAAIEAAIDSWGDANPPLRGIAWADTMSIAVRALSLLVVASFCGDSLSPATIKRLRGMLRQHARFGETFPSLHSSANNHLVGELVVSCLVSVALSSVKSAEHAAAWQPLMAEVLKQIHPDGIGAEQSPSYAAFVVECAVLAGAVVRAQGRGLPEAVRERLTRFADAIFWLCNRNGVVPQIGDDDEGTLFALRSPEPRYPASIATAVAGFLGMPVPESLPLPETLRDLVLPPASRIAPELRGLRTFPDGGLSVVRGVAGNTPYVLTFDHGPLGYLAIAAHGHADALAITLDVDGEAVFVDPGTYLYHSGGAWRDWFRGSPAHNTLNIDRKNQSTISGTFNWSRKAETTLDEFVAGEDWSVRASHDGYAGPFGVRHERTISNSPTGFVIRDRLSGVSDPVAVEIVFQLAPELEARRQDRRVEVRKNHRTLLYVEFSGEGEVGILAGGAIGEGGWVSERFGEKSPAARIAWRGRLPSEGLETVVTLPSRSTVKTFRSAEQDS
jgi:hypothetical protein